MWNPPPLDSTATVVPWQEGCDAFAPASTSKPGPTDSRASSEEVARPGPATDTGAEGTAYPAVALRLKSGPEGTQSIVRDVRAKTHCLRQEVLHGTDHATRQAPDRPAGHRRQTTPAPGRTAGRDRGARGARPGHRELPGTARPDLLGGAAGRPDRRVRPVRVRDDTGALRPGTRT